MTTDPRELEMVIRRTRHLLGAGRRSWPGGYPDAVELALIDAVFSIRARYGQVGDWVTGQGSTGVPAVVGAWRLRDGAADQDDLRHIADLPADEFADVLGNATRTSGVRKSDAVHRAARALVARGIHSAADVKVRRDEAKAAYTSVHGLGWVTFRYLCMLLGVADVKADTWITRFVSSAIGRRCTPAEAHALLHAAAQHFADTGDATLPHDPTHLDHALWHATRSERADSSVR